MWHLLIICLNYVFIRFWREFIFTFQGVLEFVYVICPCFLEFWGGTVGLISSVFFVNWMLHKIYWFSSVPGNFNEVKCRTELVQCFSRNLYYFTLSKERSPMMTNALILDFSFSRRWVRNVQSCGLDVSEVTSPSSNEASFLIFPPSCECFMQRLFFDPEDGGDMFLRNALAVDVRN
jgi:hypothetical protein